MNNDGLSILAVPDLLEWTSEREAAAEAPFKMDRIRPEIVGMQVILDGRRYRTISVRSLTSAGPIALGERIWLTVEPLG